MREILFRGKMFNGGEWVTGDIGQWPNGETKIYRHDMMDLGIVVDPSTIGQYTGIKDSNGRRIFDGDVVEGTWGGVERVPFDVELANGCWMCGMHRLYDSETITITGNIHEVTP